MSGGVGGSATSGGGTTGGTSVSGPSGIRDALTGLPGITAKTIKFGVEIAGNAPATRAAFGLPAQTGPTAQEALDILFKYMNARGGFGGRKGEYVIVETDVAEGNFETQAQSACSAFTEDHKVFAAVASIARSTTLFHCLASHKTIGMPYYPGLPFVSQEWNKLADYLYAPHYLSSQRSSAIVDVWVQQGLLKKDSRIGLISVDDPGRQQYAAVVRARLAHYGLKVQDEVRASSASDLSGLGTAGQEMSNAVLRFRSQNIDRVLFANTAGGGPFFFMPAAENQEYRPLYGISSYEFLRTLVQTAPKAALERSMGAGWSPQYDITKAKYLPNNPERVKCAKIFRDAGMEFTDATEAGIGSVCEPFFIIRDVLAKMVAGEARTFRAGFESLGTYLTPYSDPLYFAPGKFHDGITRYRHLRFANAECGCFKYVAGPYQFS